MGTLFRRFNTTRFKKNIVTFAVAQIFFWGAIFSIPLLFQLVFDLPEIQAAHAERVRAADIEAKKELECLLSNQQWKHVNRHGFVCVPK